MADVEEDVNPYKLLDVNDQATEQEIRTAYRQRSLKVHPDRNPNNPDAARKFHELNQAYELLLDPLRRLALDAKLRVKQARAKRYEAYDNKRKNMIDELEQKEREFKKRKMDQHKEEAARFNETERIKEEGRRLREEKEKELKRMEEERLHAARPALAEDEPPSLDPLDTTVRIKYSLKSHPELTTAESIATLLKPFGATDKESIVLSLKSKKSSDKPPKHGTALVPFKQIGDAFATVCASGRPERGLEGVEISWVGNKEPQILGWLKKMGKLGTPPSPSMPLGKGKESGEPRGLKAELPQLQSTGDTSFSSFPSTFPGIPIPSKEPTPMAASGLDYESLTLMRMRQAEKERLEREILEQEANES